MGKQGCAVRGCKPSQTASRYLFPHPKKYPELFEEWKNLIGNPVLINMCDNIEIYHRYRVCSSHFKDDEHTTTATGKSRLKKGVAPSKFLPSSQQHEPASAHSDVSNSCDNVYIEDHDYIKDEPPEAIMEEVLIPDSTSLDIHSYDEAEPSQSTFKCCNMTNINISVCTNCHSIYHHSCLNISGDADWPRNEGKFECCEKVLNESTTVQELRSELSNLKVLLDNALRKNEDLKFRNIALSSRLKVISLNKDANEVRSKYKL